MIFKGAAGGKVEKEASTAAEEKGAAAVTTDSGWMNGDTLLTYVRRHMKNLQRTLVVWDLFAAHRDEMVLSFLRSSGIDVIFIPGGCTGICHVMDVVVNRPFKNAIRASLTSWRAEQIRPKRSDVIGWVMDAWDNLPPSTMVFKSISSILQLLRMHRFSQIWPSRHCQMPQEMQTTLFPFSKT